MIDSMDKMQIVIEIDVRYYEILKYDVERGMDYLPCVIIAKGKPLPKGHGRLIDADAINTHDCDTCKYGVHGDERCSSCCHAYADRWEADMEE